MPHLSEHDTPSTGCIRDGAHHFPIRIYFEDTDFSGLVYHASFVRFLERGRTELLRARGLTHRELETGALGSPVFFAVHRLDLTFHAPARIDELVTVVTRPRAVSAARIGLMQQICKDTSVLVEATVSIVLLDPTNRPRRLPMAVRAALDL